MSILKFENDGPLIVASNYWESEIAAAGKLYLTMNAGCFRLLVPESQHAVISWSCHLSPGQVDRAPNHEDVGKEWRGSVWDTKKGRPHKCMERPAYFQVVPELPWLRKISN